jgi:hypothetical protein
MSESDVKAAPASTVEDDLSEFDSADIVRINLKDLIGRGVIIIPKQVKVVPSKFANPKRDGKKEAEIAVSDIVVLDGELTDQITELPFIITNTWIGDAGAFYRIREKIGRKVLATVDQRFSKEYQRNVIGLDSEVSAEVKKVARAGLTAYNEEMERRKDAAAEFESPDDDGDPF